MTSELIDIWHIIIGICVVSTYLLGLFFLNKRYSGLLFLRRGLLLFIGFLGLALLILRPNGHYPIPSVTAHLITPWAEDISTTQPIFHSVYDFLNSDMADRTVQVVIHGLGLSNEQLELLSMYDLEHHPAAQIPGITSLDVPVITERNNWTLSGTVGGLEVQSIRLGINSKKIEGEVVEDRFEIKSVAPPAGRYTINIELVSSQGDTIHEMTSIKVEEEATWKMLIFSSHPSFELNFFKNSWRARGHGFAMRSKISKDKYQSTYAHVDDKDLSSLSDDELAQFDFILTDVESWNDLLESERKDILSTVRNEGIALIFRPNEKAIQPLSVVLPSYRQSITTQLSDDIDAVDLITYLLESEWSTVKYGPISCAHYRRYGLGYVMGLAVDGTYKLMLADQEIEYQNLWSKVFSAVYIDFNTQPHIMSDPWLFAGQCSVIPISTPQPVQKPPILNGRTKLPFLSVPFIDHLIEVEVTPVTGYNDLSLGDGEALSLYAHSSDTWLAMQQKNLSEVQHQASMISQSHQGDTHMITKEYSFLWWLGFVFFGFGGLWLDERLYD